MLLTYYIAYFAYATYFAFISIYIVGICDNVVAYFTY
jgi:hypothetical protein